MENWNIDVKKLYGWLGWRRRAKFHLTERVFEAPGGGACIVLYHIGEVSLAGTAGRLAIFKNKQAPKRVFNGRWSLYWYLGDETVYWSDDETRALLYGCIETRNFWNPDSRRLNSHLAVFDMEQERWARWDRKLNDLYPLRQIDKDVFALNDKSPAPDQSSNRVDLNRLNWMRFRRFW